MRIKTWIIGLSLLSTVGCSAMNNTEKGMLGGAAVGTGAGALIGRGNPAAMVAGGIIGTAVGGIAGSGQDAREDQKRWAQAAANAQAQRQISVNEIVQMSQQRVPDQLIVNQLNASASSFELRGDDIIYLRQQGVSDYVISEMQVRRAPRAVIVQPRPVYVYDAPPPPVGVGVAVYGGR